MHKAKMTSKGQITIPAPVRQALGLTTGEKVVFLEGENGEFRLRRMESITDMYGIFRGASAPGSNAELNELMGQYATELDEATKTGPRTNSEAA